MTDNEILARWQGWGRTNGGNWINPFTKMTCLEHPDYLNDDAAAMSLLDTLVEKNINYSMTGWNNDGAAVHTIEIDHVDYALIDANANTRRAAVVAAVLELIGKENQRDQTK